MLVRAILILVSLFPPVLVSTSVQDSRCSSELITRTRNFAAEVIRLHEMGNDNLQRAADVESPNHVSAAPPPWSPPTLSADAHFTGHYAHDTDHHQQQGDNATYNTASPTFESTQDEMAHPEGTRNHGRDNMAIPPGLDDGFSSQDPPHHGRDPPPYSGTVP